MPKIIIIDHQDSFSYNLLHLFKKAGAEVSVIQNNQECGKLVEKEKPDSLIFSPGPGTVDCASDIGFSKEILQAYAGKIPILGVCLGHQLIGQFLEGEITKTSPAHGKKDIIQILSQKTLFKDFPKEIEAMRYHSLSINPESIETKHITAKSSDGNIMAIEIPDQKLYGVQFHPESIGTPLGIKLAENFLNLVF